MGDYALLYPELGLTIWSPLAGGALTGKYAKGAKGRMSAVVNAGDKTKLNPFQRRMAKRLEKASSIVDHLVPIAMRLECSVAQLALAWCAANPNVSTVILGATKT